VKICVLNSSLSHGGASVVAMDVAKGMAERGHEVAFVCSGRAGGTNKQDGHIVRILKLRRQNFLFHYLNPSLIRALKEFLWDFKPDIIHVHNINLQTFSLGSLLLSRRYHMVWTLHDLWAVCMTGWPDPHDCQKMLQQCQGCTRWPKALVKANRIIKKSVYGFSGFTVVTPSQWLADLFHGSSLSNRAAHIIPNGVDTSRFTPEQSRNRPESADSKEKTILFCGGRRVDGRSPARRKGWDYLVEALKILAKIRKDLHLLYTGDPLNLPSRFPVRVTFTGMVDREKMHRYYRAADVFVLPTLADNSPLTILEAMACKTPVVATVVGGIPEIVRHGHTGLLSPPRDAESLARCLDASLSNPSHTAEMVERAYKRVLKDFSLDQMLDNYESIYSQTISGFGRQLMTAS
jgi:glycosyltransferase involved in cell wall biosynthesis